MSENNRNHPKHIRGASKLVIDAITGITDIVESMHQIISPLAKVDSETSRPRAKGVTGLVFNSVRNITQLVGHSIDAPLALLDKLVEDTQSTTTSEAILAAINGVLGDHLEASNNHLAITMELRKSGEPFYAESLKSMPQQHQQKIVLFIHGLCMNDLQWEIDGKSYGHHLSNNHEFTDIYLFYNTGRHISENGRDLSALLERLVQQLPSSTELFIVAHSMGGLVTRSAIHYAQKADQHWPERLKKAIFLGTPHHGSPLEKGGNWIDMILDISAYSAPFSRLGKIRSHGITDLRYGTLLDEDWAERDRFDFSDTHCTRVSLPEKIDCYAVAATMSKNKTKLKDHLLGDGLVPVYSALGKHRNELDKLDFKTENQHIIRETHHNELLYKTEVYEQIESWLTSDQ